jgi:DUF4097 and DUF4098 domain-containing protein YvlB
MKRIAWIVLGICIAAAPMARADEWAKTYTVSGKPELRVDTSDADISVDTWDKNTIEAHITSNRFKINGSDLKLDEHQSGDTVQISLRFPSHPIMFGFGGKNQRVEITIHMPREGRMNLRTGDGHIRIANFKGAMELESGDGHQDIDSVDGTLRARTGDGHIHARGRFDNLELSTSDGSVDARVMNGSTMNSSWTVRTGDGSVTLDLPEHFAADLDMHTGDGHIRVDMPLAVEGHISERNIHGKLNGGGNTLTVHTGDGSINLQKS